MRKVWKYIIILFTGILVLGAVMSTLEAIKTGVWLPVIGQWSILIIAIIFNKGKWL